MKGDAGVLAPSSGKRLHEATSRNDRGRQRRHHNNNPSRGGPAMLLTCEQGREKKCEREGLEILKYYWEAQESRNNTQLSAVGTTSLDDELETLRARVDEKNTPFRIFDTGCKGTVVIMCTLPNCHLIPPIVRDDDTKHESKKPRVEPIVPQQSAPWDPIQTVRSVVQDLVAGDSSDLVPGSRFVSRMIPMQATCFASLEDIHQVVAALLNRLLPNLAPIAEGETPQSFGIKFKRRNCSLLQRDAVIEAVATQVTKKTSWSVKLREPDFTIMIEVCKTLCGISILPSSCQTVAPNFNLATLRAKEGAAAE